MRPTWRACVALIAPYSLNAARALWIVGAMGIVPFSCFVISRWMSDEQLVAHATPAWFLPVVGLLNLPLSLPTLDLQGLHGLMDFSLAVGLFFAVPLFTLIFLRSSLSHRCPRLSGHRC